MYTVQKSEWKWRTVSTKSWLFQIMQSRCRSPVWTGVYNMHKHCQAWLCISDPLPRDKMSLAASSTVAYFWINGSLRLKPGKSDISGIWCRILGKTISTTCFVNVRRPVTITIHHRLKKVDLVSMWWGLSFIMMATCQHNMQPVQACTSNWVCLDILQGRRQVGA